MHFRVEYLPDDRILIVALNRDYIFGKETQALEQTVNDSIPAGETEIQAIYDLREIKMSFGDLVLAMANQTQKAAGSLGDPRLKAVIVGSGEMVRLGILAFQQEQYGKMKFPLFDSMEEALKYAREQNRKRG